MRATDDLLREHQLLLPFFDALESAARRLEARQPIRPSFFVDASEFIGCFVGNCHHNKEEGALFPALEAAGVPQLGGLMGEILAEHDEGRRLALQVRAGAENLVRGDLTARPTLAWNALTYVRLIRPHIAREETALFPLAHRMLSADQQKTLAREFERMKAEQSGKELHQRCVSLAQSLRSEARSA